MAARSLTPSGALVESLYDALGAPAAERHSRIVNLLEAAAPFAAVSVLGIYGDWRSSYVTPSQSWDPKVVADYVAHYHRVSPWTTSHLSTLAGDIYVAREVAPDFSRSHSEFYNDWAVPGGKGAGVAMKALRSDDFSAILSFDYALTTDAEVDDALSKFVRTLRPHLSRMLSLARTLERVGAETTNLRHALDASATPTFILDGSLHIEEMNAAARRLIAASVGFTLDRAGRLGFARSADAARLNRFVATAGTPLAAPAERGDTLAIQLDDDTMDVALVSARPCPGAAGHAASLDGSPRFVVTVRAPGLAVPPDSAALEAAFGLTPAETNVALRLAEGRSVAEISVANGVTPHTVRTQIKRVFAKTRRNRQSELVRLFLSLGER